MQVSTIGVDLAKNVFQVHGVDSAGKVVITRQLRRKQVIDFFSKIPPTLKLTREIIRWGRSRAFPE